MSFITAFLLSIALALDGFMTSEAIGNQQKRFTTSILIKVPFIFAVFQGLFAFIGWWLSIQISNASDTTDTYIAFALLAFIGFRMIYESSQNTESDQSDDLGATSSVFYLATISGIDALAVGVSYGLINIEIYALIIIITIITAIATFVGFCLGVRKGNVITRRSKFFSGIIIISLAIKILTDFYLYD